VALENNRLASNWLAKYEAMMADKSIRSEFIFGSAAKPFTGRKMLILILSFFLVIISVNGIFAYFALDSWTGLETEKSYDKGVRYNDTLAAAAAQDALGWQAAFSEKKLAKASYQINLNIKDKAGKPVHGLIIAGALRRPTHGNADQDLQLTELSPGRYQTTVNSVALGNWELRLATRTSDGTKVRWQRRLWLK
jgi:nitrogen fixation protein FixH